MSTLMEALKIVSESWPIAVMVIGLAAAHVIRRSLRQAMDNSEEVRNLRASNAMVVRDHE